MHAAGGKICEDLRNKEEDEESGPKPDRVKDASGPVSFRDARACAPRRNKADRQPTTARLLLFPFTFTFFSLSSFLAYLTPVNLNSCLAPPPTLRRKWPPNHCLVFTLHTNIPLLALYSSFFFLLSFRLIFPFTWIWGHRQAWSNETRRRWKIWRMVLEFKWVEKIFIKPAPRRRPNYSSSPPKCTGVLSNVSLYPLYPHCTHIVPTRGWLKFHILRDGKHLLLLMIKVTSWIQSVEHHVESVKISYLPKSLYN